MVPGRAFESADRATRTLQALAQRQALPLELSGFPLAPGHDRVGERFRIEKKRRVAARFLHGHADSLVDARLHKRLQFVNPRQKNGAGNAGTGSFRGPGCRATAHGGEMPAGRTARYEDAFRIDSQRAGPVEQGIQRGPAFLHDLRQAGLRRERIVDRRIGDPPLAKSVRTAKGLDFRKLLPVAAVNVHDEWMVLAVFGQGDIDRVGRPAAIGQGLDAPAGGARPFAPDNIVPDERRVVAADGRTGGVFPLKLLRRHRSPERPAAGGCRLFRIHTSPAVLRQRA